jgi:hypothetical protein
VSRNPGAYGLPGFVSPLENASSHYSVDIDNLSMETGYDGENHGDTAQ